MESKSYEDEASLITDLKSGEDCAYRFLYKHYYKELCVYMTSVSGDVLLAREFAQQTFIKLWRRREVLVIKKSLSSYIRRMAYNLYIDSIRQTKKEELLLEKLRYQVSLETITNTPDNFDEKLKAVQAEIELLPLACKRIFLLSKKSGLTYREIALELDISINTVESQMGKALGRLRGKLKKHLLFLILISRIG